MQNDTIAAIATAMSPSGIGIIRISGDDALSVIDRIYKSKNNKKKISACQSHTIHYGFIYDGDEKIDEVMVLLMKAPNTYTREDTVEIDCHGGVYVMKRVLDFIISLFALIILSPLFLFVSLIILISDGKPILFRQKRVGRNNELFTIYKFRTMKRGTENVASGELENANSKITKFGKFLRATSVDELPQLFNILNGTMSLIGPRPLIPEETEIRQLREKYNVYSIRPGITGWAQVNGRDNISIENKALLDKEYVEKQSLAFDIKIFFLTVLKVLRRDDVREGSDGN